MRKSILDTIFDILIYIGFALFTLICTYPFYFLLINSFSSAQDVINGVYLFPNKITLENYAMIFSTPKALNAAKISALRTIAGTIITINFSSFFAYLVTKNKLPYRKFMYRFVIMSMYISAGLIPWYVLMMKLGLKNNFLLYIVPVIIQPYFIVLIKTYIESIPVALEESALIDGAGLLTVFYRIIIPMSLPILAAVMVFNAVTQWNGWQDNLYLANTSSLKTLQLYLFEIMQQNMGQILSQSTTIVVTDSLKKTNPMSLKIAITMVTVVPIMLVYPLLQRFFIKGIMLGAIKG